MPITKDRRKEFLSKADFLVKKNLRKAAIAVKNDAREDVPVDTGKLQRSIRYDFVNPHEVHVGSIKEYAAAVEKGTPTQNARPYLRTALHKNRRMIADILRDNSGIMKKFS